MIKPTSSKLRLCLNMRHVNEAIVRERHVMPKIKDILTEPHQPKTFSKIGLGEGYHQLLLYKDSQHTITFAKHEKLFRYKRLVYDISNAFESFQKHIEKVIAGCPGSKNISDNILILGKDQHHHYQDLSTALCKIEESGLKINREKCVFSVADIIFAGHHLPRKSISPDPSIVKSIANL